MFGAALGRANLEIGMGSPQLLKEYRLFHSTDLDEAREQVARIFCPHRLEITAAAHKRLDACHNHARLRNISLNYVQYGADVLIDPGELGSFFLIQIPLAGSAHIRCGRHSIDSTPGLASVPTPTQHLTMRWSRNCGQLIVWIDRQALEHQLSLLLDAPLKAPIRFDLGFDMTSGMGLSWRNAILFLAQELERPNSLLSTTLGISDFEQMLMNALLTGQHHNYSEQLARTQSPAAPRHVTRALAYIQANADKPLTIDKLVEVSGISARSLFEGFRKFEGTTPMAYVRSLRLERAHADLTATPAPSVTEVAMRHGFTHLGRFAGLYRRRYGQTPTQTRAKGHRT